MSCFPKEKSLLTGFFLTFALLSGAETVKIQNCQDAIIKEHSSQNKPYNKMNFSNSKKSQIAWIGGWSCRSLIKFQLPESLNGKKIKSAKLKIYQSKTSKGVEKEKICLYEVLKDWKEKEITWESFDNGGKPSITYNPTPLASCVFSVADEKDNKNKCLTIELNPFIVQKWIDKPSENKGIILMSSVRQPPGSGVIKSFYSSKAGENLKPALILETKD